MNKTSFTGFKVHHTSVQESKDQRVGLNTSSDLRVAKINT